MASSVPNKVFLIPEILEMILLETDTRTLLTSAQRVCHKWHCLIKQSTALQAALFFKPVKYTLPRGVSAIRNPFLTDDIWPWFCAKYVHRFKAPPVEGGVKIAQIDDEYSERFAREGASWKRMLFQQPPRSCIGLVEKLAKKNGNMLDGPAYTEVHVRPNGDDLRIGDLVYPCGWYYTHFIHPLPNDGLLWFGNIYGDEYFADFPYVRGYRQEIEDHGDISQRQVAHAISTYLRDCDAVFFILECSRFRGEYIDSRYDSGKNLRYWLRDMNGVIVAGQKRILMNTGE